VPAIISAMENVHLLIEDVEMLSRAAIEGSWTLGQTCQNTKVSTERW
jgi:hypothetical protein